MSEGDMEPGDQSTMNPAESITNTWARSGGSCPPSRHQEKGPEPFSSREVVQVVCLDVLPGCDLDEGRRGPPSIASTLDAESKSQYRLSALGDPE